MKHLFIAITIFICGISASYAGCAINIGGVFASGNYSYDSVAHTYYIHPGDTMFLYYGTYYGGTDSHNWCYYNDTVSIPFISNMPVTMAGTYSYYGGCGADSMYLGSVKVSYYTVAGIAEASEQETIKAYYNPAEQSVLVNYSNLHQPVSYSLYNISGQQILRGSFVPFTGSNQQHSIPFSNWAGSTDMYLLSIETAGKRYTLKFVRQNI